VRRFRIGYGSARAKHPLGQQSWLELADAFEGT
jgi:hypothetical protein